MTYPISYNDVAIISDSRASLERAFNSLERIGRWSREQYLELHPIGQRLWDRQIEIERLAGLNAPALGGFFIPLIVGGMALLGVGGWAWKQHRETAGYEKYLDCLEKMQAAGMSPGEAAMVCRGEGQTTVEGLNKLMNTAMVLGLLAAGIWLMFKLSK